MREQAKPPMPRSPLRHTPLLLVLAAPLVLVGAMLAANHWLAPAPRGQAYVVTIDLPPAGEIGLPQVAGPLDASRPLVVIDAGHGGHDPGAHNGALHEKELTLGLALALRGALLAGGGIRVALTRDDDRYLALQERFGIARRLKADLFISIHADSAPGAAGGQAHGGTVYTLSRRGTDEEAERLARSENAADTVNGVSLGGAGGPDSQDVSAILVDLSQRQSAAQSNALASLILREGAGRLPFRPHPIESAAFVVLKSPDVPSVLFEAGYISNADDAGRLASPEGRTAFAEVTARAIRIYFARASAAVAGP